MDVSWGMADRPSAAAWPASMPAAATGQYGAAEVHTGGPTGSAPDDSVALARQSTWHSQVGARHIGRDIDAEQRQNRRSHVAESAAVTERGCVSSTSTKGTGLVVCAVCGPPVSGSIICSQLP